MGRLCKNHITDQIRDQFGANPVKIPESRIQPMCMLEIKKNTSQFLGAFKYLIDGGFNHEVPMSINTVSDVSDSKSKSIDFEIGFDILSGFLKALKLDPVSIKTSLSKSKKMAFSFSNVRRKYIDPLFLGSLLSQNQLMADTANFMLAPAIEDKQVKLGLITDVILSNNFILSTFSESDNAVDIDIPQIDQIISGVGAGIKLHKQSENEVKFEGAEDLTFAFSCLELTVDPASGRFGRGDWFRDIRDRDAVMPGDSAMGQIPEQEESLNRLLIDDNQGNPLLIEL